MLLATAQTLTFETRLVTHLVTRLAAAEAVATSADEEVVCEGEKTREERDAELRGEAVSLDE